jgi:hypothetical protein
VSREREDELIREISGWMIGDAPEGWRRIDLLVHVGYEHLLSILLDVTRLEGEPAPAVTPLLRELLGLMDHGWHKFRLVIDPPDTYHARFNAARDTVADELLFLLPAGWESAQIQSRSALIHSVTGLTYPWTPPEGLVPDGTELTMKHPFSFTMTTRA